MPNVYINSIIAKHTVGIVDRLLSNKKEQFLILTSTLISIKTN